MKKILALTARLTLCTVAPVQAGAIVKVNFGLSDDRDSGLIIIPSQQQYWEGAVGYQDGWDRPYYYLRYRYNRFYDPRVRGFSPRYRYSRFYDPRVGESRPRHRHGHRYYHPSLTLHPIWNWLLMESYWCYVAAIAYNLN